MFAAAVAGCTGTGEVRYSAQVSTPDLVEVEPGVQVVADADYPVFFSDNYYWRYDAGVWYRSPYANRAWVRVEAPPVAVRRIDRPERFAHYRRDHRNEAPRGENRLDRDRAENQRLEAQYTEDRREIDRAEARGDRAGADRARERMARDKEAWDRQRARVEADQR